jgi:hypothetical protein
MKLFGLIASGVYTSLVFVDETDAHLVFSCDVIIIELFPSSLTTGPNKLWLLILASVSS